MLRTSLPAVFVALGCTLLVMYRVAVAKGPEPLRAATPVERAEIAQTIASLESTWSNETTQNFPADSWSQRDDFHGREYKKVQEISKEKRIRIEDVLRAVD